MSAYVPPKDFPVKKQIALLMLRRSAIADDCIRHLLETRGNAIDPGEFIALGNEGLATRQRGKLILTYMGRRFADQISIHVARQFGLHHIVYGLRGPGAAYARCCCGWSSYRTRAIPNYYTKLMGDAGFHLRHVGAPIAGQAQSEVRAHDPLAAAE